MIAIRPLKNRIGIAQATQSNAREEETPDSLGFTATS
jgi:hypothetical protein